jgi:hypothetical protein
MSPLIINLPKPLSVKFYGWELTFFFCVVKASNNLLGFETFFEVSDENSNMQLRIIFGK